MALNQNTLRSSRRRGRLWMSVDMASTHHTTKAIVVWATMTKSVIFWAPVRSYSRLTSQPVVVSNQTIAANRPSLGKLRWVNHRPSVTGHRTARRKRSKAGRAGPSGRESAHSTMNAKVTSTRTKAAMVCSDGSSAGAAGTMGCTHLVSAGEGCFPADVQEGEGTLGCAARNAHSDSAQ